MASATILYQGIILYFAFFCSIFNFPLIKIGDNALGIFDIYILVISIFIFFPFKPRLVNPFVLIYFLFASLVLFSSLLNVFGGADVGLVNLLYILKLFQIPLSGYVYMRLVSNSSFSVNRFDNVVSLQLSLLLMWNIFDVLLFGSFRSGVPFSYGSSGPLGLLAISFLIYGAFRPKCAKSNYIMLLSILVLLLSLSKSFLLCVPLVIIAASRLKFRVIYIIYAGLISSISLFLLSFENLLSRNILFLSRSALNFSELSSLNYRLSRHWFVNFDSHYADDLLFLFGGGAQSIAISYDSLYFYLFYTIGIVGSLVFLGVGIFLAFRNNIFATYFITMLVSGVFLETSLISYRGIEPSLLLLIVVAYQVRRSSPLTPST